MNPFLIRGGDVSIFSIPLRAPFVTALGSKTKTTNVALRLSLASGARGYGEASGSVVMSRLKPPSLKRALEDLLRRAQGRDARRLRTLSEEAWSRCPQAPAAAAAFECAVLEALCAARNVPPASWFGGALDRVETDLTLSAWPAACAGAAAKKAVRKGFKTLKVKVGTGDPGADLERLKAVDAARPRPRIIIDGNQGLSQSSASRLVEACLREGMNVVLLEQPLPRENLRGMASLSRSCPVPLAADESVRSEAEAFRVLDLGAARVLNVKAAKTGLLRSLKIIGLCRSAAAELMIGCMQESARGLTASVHLACGTGAFKFVDLDSDCLLGRPQPRGGFNRRGPVVSI